MNNGPDILRILGKVLLILGLVLFNGFFVAAEFALVKVRETQLDMLVAKRNRRAKVARSIIANLNTYLSASQLGITMASLGLGWVGEPLFYALLSPLLLSLRRSIGTTFCRVAITTRTPVASPMAICGLAIGGRRPERATRMGRS